MDYTMIIKAYGEICGDNRFELIEKFKKELFEHTNIETAKDEVAVLDSLLFRCWQMGWLDKLEDYDRQDAEIERLNAVSEICGDCHKKYAEKIQTAKSEAIKEFWGKLQRHDCTDVFGNRVYAVYVEDGDNIVKEMTE